MSVEGIIGRKVGMTQVYTDDGRALPVTVIEAGPCVVVQRKSKNGDGYSAVQLGLVEQKKIKRVTKPMQGHFKKAGVEDIITVIEGDAHETVKQHTEPIDILFLDADKAGYIDYLKKLLPLVRPGGLIVAHNMSPRQADPKYLKAITTNAELETIFLHMQAAGVGVTMKKR